MLAGLVIVPVVSLFTRAPEQGHIDDIFACYERTITVTVKDSIGNPERRQRTCSKKK